MKKKNSNAFVQKNSRTYSKEDAFHVIYLIIGILELANVFLVHSHLNTINKQVDVYALLKNRI